MMPSVFLLMLSAAEAGPDRVAHTFALGTQLSDIRYDDDRDWMSVVVDGEIQLLSARSWNTQTISSVCSGSTATSSAFYQGTDLLLYVGCDDGTVDVVRYLSSSGDWSLSVSSQVGSNGSGSTGDTGDTTDTSSGSTTYDFGTAVLDVQVHNGTVYTLVESDTGGNPVVRSLTPYALTVNDSTSYSVAVTGAGFRDGALNANTGQYYVMHSTSNVSVVTLASGALTSNMSSIGGDGGDIAVFDSDVLMAGGNQGILRYTTTNQILVALNSSDMSDVVALGSYAGNTGLVVADEASATMLLYEMSTASLSINGALVDRFSYSGDGVPVEMVSLDTGYVLAGTDAGEVLLMTGSPWISFSTNDGQYDGVSVGSEIALQFSADEAGDWELRIGENGETVSSGTLEADKPVTAAFTVEDGQLTEGLNELWVVVTDSSGDDGHAAYEVIVDQPPAEVELGASDVGFGNNSIIVTINGIDDEDLSGYDVYVSANAFAKESYVASGTGGPEFCTDAASSDTGDTGASSAAVDCSALTALSVPVSVTAAAGETAFVEIEDVDNGYTYYVAVRAVDAGGLEGPMSTVRSVVPQETYSAAQLAGEAGGFCGSPLPASLALAGLGGLLTLARRRRLGLLAAICAAVGLGSPSAQADEPSPANDIDTTAEVAEVVEDSPGCKHCTSGSSLTVGSIAFDDSSLNSVYGSSGNLSLLFAQSFSYRHLLEIETMAGFARGKGNTVSSSGVASSQDVRLNVVPISVSGVFRLDLGSFKIKNARRPHLLEDQPIVPYVNVGLDYWLWRENWDTEFRIVTGNAIGGGKMGYHWAVGGQILLDIFDRTQASTLEARKGIQDTYLSVEYRENHFSEVQEDGLIFDGKQLTAGLRFDY